MKKFELHIDAVAVIALVFLVSFAFNFYQRYQYADLLEEHISLQYDAFGLENHVGNTRVALQGCINELEANKTPVDL